VGAYVPHHSAAVRRAIRLSAKIKTVAPTRHLVMHHSGYTVREGEGERSGEHEAEGWFIAAQRRWQEGWVGVGVRLVTHGARHCIWYGGRDQVSTSASCAILYEDSLSIVARAAFHQALSQQTPHNEHKTSAGCVQHVAPPPPAAVVPFGALRAVTTFSNSPTEGAQVQTQEMKREKESNKRAATRKQNKARCKISL
jgi:hypothetical protein